MHLIAFNCLALCACVRYPAFLSVVDIAGLVKGASEGQVRVWGQGGGSWGVVQSVGWREVGGGDQCARVTTWR